MSTNQLPTSLPFTDTFRCALRHVCEQAYPHLLSDAGQERCDDEDAFKADLANAISEALGVLGIDEHPAAGDWLGELYDLADELGIRWDA